ncbi:AAA family ATPase [Actinotalea sp. Marseille-Q4924]|uniref:ATP-binding protein n=1 Tax=Actinotalea sp. Marseille-Q4924 TaxID=2866571 RepID=UPI001CE3F31B|nr:AAA family ATPase [Actinotalea sp. Marseille-Q4924]
MRTSPTGTDLPTGTVTLLFTDVESSTRLLARLGARYADVVSTQRRLVRSAVSRWGGHELGTEGDSFFVVFPSARDAVCAVRDAQLELAGADWPDGETVRVRMGLHTGEPSRHEDGYVGMDVHRAARVAASAHGGQSVVTDATRALVAAHPVPGVRFTDLGPHRLKDLPEPVHVHQLCVDGLPATFPRLKSLGSPSTLPTPATSLVGRTEELGTLAALLTAPDVRLVTLTGPAGTGKTRLALAVAARVDEHYRDGVYFVPLAQARTSDVLWTTVADAMGVPGESKPPPAFLEHLADQEVLLVLDNLEQLPDAPWVVRALLGAGTGVRVLTTSRRPLHLAAEREVPVPPLPTTPAATDGHESDAVRLFVERARLVRPGFALTDENRDDVVEVCRRLDGLPLAIELVAARTRLLGPAALRARLDRSLDPPGPSGAAVDAPDRQQTLRAALDWSHDLLDEDLARAFRRLGVCVGAVDLAAVAAVVGDGGDAADAVDVVGRLADVSLLTVRDGPDGEPRARMLQTIRRYARERLAAAGELEAAHRRHAEHFVGLARAAAEGLRGEHHLAARDRIEADLDDLRSVLTWAFGPGTATVTDDDEGRLALGLRLVQHLAWFWYGCGYQAEGRRWLQTAVDAAGTRRTPQVMTALHGLGVLVLQQGHAERARDMLTVCLEHARTTGDPALVSKELNSLAMAHRALDEPRLATAVAEEAVAAARTAGDPRNEVNAVSNLALLAADDGRHDEAIALLRRCLELDTELQDAWGLGADHVNLVGSLLRAGRTAEAHAHLREHAASAVALNDLEITVDVLTLFAVVAARRGEAVRAARLLGASTHLREEADLPMAPVDAAWVGAAIDSVRDITPADAWQRDVDTGRDWGVEAALREAVAD